MRVALFALLAVVVTACSSLPKMAPEDHDCLAVFQIKQIDKFWEDIRYIKNPDSNGKEIFPEWFGESKFLLDGYNNIYYNPYWECFLGIKYKCRNYVYDQKQKSADMILFEKHCLSEKSKSLNVPNLYYEYAIPQNLNQNLAFDNSRSFSVYERLIAINDPNKSAFENDIDNLAYHKAYHFRFTVIGDHNNGKAFILQISLLTKKQSLVAIDYFESVVNSIQFSKK